MRLSERAAKLSIPKRMEMQNIEKELEANPLISPPSEIASKAGEEVEFPINTVSKFQNFTFHGRDKELADVREALNRSLIPGNSQVWKNTTKPYLLTKPRFADTIRSLRSRHLVGRDTSGSLHYLTIHRTVQLAVLHDLSKTPELRRIAFTQAFTIVEHAMPKVSSTDNPEPSMRSDLQKYVPHFLSMRAHCLWPEPPMELNVGFAQVLSGMATFMWHAGLLTEGIDAMQTAEHILDFHKLATRTLFGATSSST